MRHFLTLSDLSKQELLEVLRRASELKQEKKRGVPHPLLQGKTLAMIFEKPSNRTRVSFEVGMYQLGGHAINIRASEIQLGSREPIRDAAAVLSRYVDCVMYRSMRHCDVEAFADSATVPVINGLSDMFHPCQILADLQTINEHFGEIQEKKICYIGDGNNVCNSLIVAATLLGLELVVSCPNGCEPTLSTKNYRYTLEHSPEKAVVGADVLYTDVWCSMGEEGIRTDKLKRFAGYTINRQLLERANSKAIVLHCLPAHRGEEIEGEVFDRFSSVIFDQAENRLHAQKAILSFLLGSAGTTPCRADCR